VVVSAMQSSHDAELAQENQAAHDERGQILAEVRQLRHDIQARREKGTGP